MDLEDFYKGDYNFYSFDETFRRLAEKSNVAKLYSLGYEFFICNPNDTDEYFHHSGTCGCLKGGSSYKLGICTDELVWAEGFHEEYYIHDQYGNYYDNCLYVFGSDKGIFQSFLIVFCTKDVKDSDYDLYRDWFERPIDTNGYIIKPVLTRSNKQNDYMFSSTIDRLCGVFDFNELRYVIVNSNNGDVVDDAQGWGYRTREKAYKAYYYNKNNNFMKYQKNK